MNKEHVGCESPKYERVYGFFLFLFFLTALRMWDHTSLTRDPVLPMVKAQKS